MNLILLVATIGMIMGLFIVLKISPKILMENTFEQVLKGRKKSLKDKLDETTKRKKLSFLKRELEQTQNILELTGRSEKFPMVCMTSMVLFIIGACISILMGNFFLLPILSVGFMFFPLWYVKLTETHFKKDIASELETALSIITTGYLRSENIVTSIEENIGYLNPPVLSVFQSFLYQIKMVNPDIIKGLEDMKGKISNPVYTEWIDGVIQCQHDRTLKSTLIPIVSKLSDMRIVNGELENMVTTPRQEFITMVALVISNIPLLYFLNKDWYNTLMHTLVGKIVLAICAVVIFISTACVIKLTSPIEYRR